MAKRIPKLPSKKSGKGLKNNPFPRIRGLSPQASNKIRQYIADNRRALIKDLREQRKRDRRLGDL